MKKLCLFLFVIFYVQLAYSNYYRSNVTASYYADAFHGKKTSNGEIFNMYALTCAHKMLPFNTVVRVTNIKNGKSVDLRVNDRGPFVGNREMDLSKAAAVKLDMIKSGTAKVNIQILKLGPETKASVQTARKACKAAKIAYNSNFSNSIKTSVKPAASKTASAGTSRASVAVKQADAASLYDIQLGAFSSRSNANTLAQKLLKEGFRDVVFQVSDETVRVVIRKVPYEKLAETELSLNQKGYSGYVVKKRKI